MGGATFALTFYDPAYWRIDFHYAKSKVISLKKKMLVFSSVVIYIELLKQ